MKLLSKIYGLVQAGRYLFYMFCGDRSDQSQADPRVFRTFDDGEVKIVVVMFMDNILAHAQGTMDRLATELGGKFNAKSMVEKSGVGKPSRTPAFLEGPALSQSG